MEGNGVLETLGDKIEALLKTKRISATTRAQLEIQQLFLVYLKQDHVKVVTMWAVFRPMAWGMSIAAATIIGLLASGHMQVIVK